MSYRQQQNKFKLAVYIAVLSFAFVFLLISFIVENSYWQNLLMNIGTDLLGVALLFFVVNKLFGLDTDETISGRLETLINILERRVNVLNDREEGRKKLQLSAVIQTAQELDVIGYNLPNFLQEFYEPMFNRVQAGANIRVMLIDPKSTARELVNQNTVMYDFDSNTERAIKYMQMIQDRINANPKKVKGSFEFRVLNWIPSCNVVIVNKNLVSGIAKVEIYSLHYRIPIREGGINFILNRTEQPQWFDYYVNQYEKTWDRGEPYNLDNR